MNPSTWSEVLGLLLFALLVLAAASAVRLYRRIRARRLYRAAELPLPGRTRDVTGLLERSAS